jgi:hypothetical protein
MHMYHLLADGTHQTMVPLTAFQNIHTWESWRAAKKPPRNTPLPAAALYLEPSLGEIEICHGEVTWKGKIKKAVLLGINPGTCAVRTSTAAWTVNISPGAGTAEIRSGFDPDWVKSANRLTSPRPEWQSAVDATQAWFHEGRVGVSSEAMANYLVYAAAGLPFESPESDAHPYDASDFRRCQDFLAAVPQAREQLPRMAEISKEWEAIVTAWVELEGLMQEDAQDNGRRTSDRLRALLNRPVRRAGP